MQSLHWWSFHLRIINKIVKSLEMLGSPPAWGSFEVFRYQTKLLVAMSSQAYIHPTSEGLPVSKPKLLICPSLLLKISNIAHTLAKTITAFTNLRSRQATASKSDDKRFLLQMVLSWQTQRGYYVIFNYMLYFDQNSSSHTRQTQIEVLQLLNVFHQWSLLNLLLNTT